MLKSYVKEKIMQVMKKNEEELVSAEFRACLLVSPSGYISGNVRCYAHLALASLFGTISDPQSMAVSFRFSWSPLFCPATISSAQGQGVVLLMSKSTTKMTNTCLQWGDSGEIGMDESLSHPRRVLFTLQGR